MGIKLEDILTPDFQSEIQDSLAHATGFGVVFVDKEGCHIGKGGNFCRFCEAINSLEEGRTACQQSNRDAILESLRTRETSIYLCHAGLVSFVIPLLYEDEYLGAITAGQTLCYDMESFPQYTSPPKDWLTDTKLRKYHQEIRILERRQIEGATIAFHNISNYILQTFAYNTIFKTIFLYNKFVSVTGLLSALLAMPP